MSLTLLTDGGQIYKPSLNLKDSYFRHFEPLRGKDGFSIYPVLHHPRSKGEILLQSSNPFHYPRIRPNFFDDPLDVATMVEGITQLVEQSMTLLKTLLDVAFMMLFV